MRIAVSACLLGETCRYDGRSKPCARVQELAADGHELVPICPEVAGGLPTPRTPCEIVQAPWMESGKARMADEHAWTILDASGTDCTAAYARGAQAELARAKEAGCELVGIGCAVEKGFQHGGDKLREAGVNLKSLAILEKAEPGCVEFRED